MPIPAQVFSPIRARGGRRVHAITLHRPTHTACGRRCRGWLVPPLAANDPTAAAIEVDCVRCHAHIMKPRTRARK